MHLAFLLVVTLTPFSASLLAEHIGSRTALLVYWFNILLLGVTLYLSWDCAIGLSAVKPDISPAIIAAIRRRILIAQSLYAVGAALCFISPYWSIAIILLLQLNYAVAPRLRRTHDEAD